MVCTCSGVSKADGSGMNVRSGPRQGGHLTARDAISHQCHTALGGQPPISGVNNAEGQYT
ncbi:hypothetical protein [Actinomadura sp. 6N118]|uniref:hypothetical protein n=1 Tax=Actinomadura sp. 6N118 TaxID=3375151 RepID=UPI0037A444E0